MRTLFPVCLALLVACGGGKDTDTEPAGDDNADDGPDTQHTGSREPALKHLEEMQFHAFIAWDEDLQQIVPPLVDGEENLSVFVITIGQANWTYDDPSSYCELFLNLDGYGESPDAQAEAFLWGVDINVGEAVDASESCIENGWDPTDFLDGSPLNDWGAHDYHLRLGFEPGEEMVDWLTGDNPPTDFNVDLYAGGHWWSDAAEVADPGEDFVYWYGYEMDAERNVDLDAEKEQADMPNNAGTLSTGYYIMRMRIYWFWS